MFFITIIDLSIKAKRSSGVKMKIYKFSAGKSADSVSKEYEYLMPYYLQYKKKYPNCSFKDYVSWAKDYRPGNYETPEADPDFDRNNESIRGGYSSARCLAKNGEGYITIWIPGI